MKNKGNTGILIAVILLAVGIVLCAAAAVGISLSQRVGALHPRTQENIAGRPEPTGDSEVEEQSMTLNDFAVSLVGENAPEETGQDEEKPEDAGPEEAEADTEYLCAYSDSILITDEDMSQILAAHSADEMPAGKLVSQMIINEMYARYGYRFMNAEIQEYFDQKIWYQAITDSTDDMDAVYREMSDVEKANIDFLKNYEE